MISTQIKTYSPIIFGLLTLILFSTAPFILDLIEPHKSLGQMIGENTKDLLDSMNGKQIEDRSLTNKEVWSNVITIISFILFGISILTSLTSLKIKSTRGIGITGVLLSLFGLSFFFTYLAIGMIGLIVILGISVVLVLILKFD